ncbi:MAG: hypothetical protein LUC33_03050, partial [Prevotellaceae bacterium]|nr:hypothetical protein [Prevotellaceae bacterium]
MTKRLLPLLFSLLATAAYPQVSFNQNGDSSFGSYDQSSGSIDAGNNHLTWGRDTTKNKRKFVPIGVHQWTVEERLGTIVDVANTDTAVHAFQFWNSTEGMNGEYTILGNLGSPRLSRVFFYRQEASQLLFVDPYSFFIG